MCQQPDGLSRPVDYYLRVTAREESKKISNLLTNRSVFKFMSESTAHRPVPGIPLEEGRSLPPEFPTQADYHYYRLLRSENPRLWDKIKEEGSMAIFWRGMEEFPLKFTLCMTFGPSET